MSDVVAASRSRAFPAVIGAFLAGVLVAAVVLPSHSGDGTAGGDATVALTGGTGAAAGAPAESGTVDTVPVDTAPPATDTFTGGAGPSGGTTPTQPAASGSPSAPAGSSPTSAPAAAAGNSGASARGVTASKITIGVIDLDSSDLAAACPRCVNGPSKDGGAELAYLAKWKKDGRLPVAGRDVEFVFRKVTVTSPEANRNACVAMAQQVKPFLVVAGPGTEAAVQCLTQEFKIPVLHGAGGVYAPESTIRQVSPYWIEVGPSSGRLLRSFAAWANRNGLLRGHKIGIYAPEDDTANAAVDGFRQGLQQQGVTPVIDFRASGTQGIGTTSASDPVAVQRFRAAGVDVAFLFAGSLGFQKAAQGQGYRPKYPMVDWANTFTDAVADIGIDADAMDGNIGMSARFWSWSARRPATPRGNPAATECLQLYSAYAKRTLDAFDNDAEIRYISELCSDMVVLMRALEVAGGNLTVDSLIAAAHTVKGVNTAQYPSVSLVGRADGADLGVTYTFVKARHAPENDYWYQSGGFEPLAR